MSRETAKPPVWNPGMILRRGVSLLIVMVFVLGSLTLLYQMTDARVVNWEWERNSARLALVMPEANAFSAIRYDDGRPDDIQAAYRDSTLLGYCVQVTVHGFSGEIRLLVGVTPEGEVTGVALLDEQESKGLGEEQDTFLNQFNGRSGTITVNQGRNAVNAVSGATATCEAVAEGVSTALSVVAHLDLEGGMIFDEEGEV